MFHENWYSDDQCNNVAMLLTNIKHLSGSIIEVGCWEGKSTYHLANAAYPETIICNDTWLGNVAESIVCGEKHVSEIILQNRDVYSVFLKNMNRLTKRNYTVVKDDCLKWLKDYNEPIKFIHIDASHEYESVYQTIQLALPKMVNGGIVCGDDFLNSNAGCYNLHGGVERAVRESFGDDNFTNIGNLWYYFHNK
jgi:predicted O-methyltransferase YrrM